MAQRGCLSERVCVFLISRGFAAHQLTRRSWAEHAHTQKDSKSRNDLVSIISQDLWVVSMSSSRGMHCESFRTLQTCRFSQYEGFCAKFESYKLHSHHFHISITSHILIPHLKMSPYLTSVLIMTLQSQCSCCFLRLQTSTLLSTQAAGPSLFLPSLSNVSWRPVSTLPPSLMFFSALPFKIHSSHPLLLLRALIAEGPAPPSSSSYPSLPSCHSVSPLHLFLCPLQLKLQLRQTSREVPIHPLSFPTHCLFGIRRPFWRIPSNAYSFSALISFSF